MSLTEFATFFEQLEDCELTELGKVSHTKTTKKNLILAYVRDLHAISYDPTD